MVELGADLEEIIRECELPRAEAELLMSLHKQKKAPNEALFYWSTFEP